ncbi:unannotated protein [freshwater metagenome]|uniref:Unannotated protein n=1 Tax=freshwater metagenome TaxID=449393 RepID=A0A6J7ANV5_9ZZZZ
MVTIASNTKPIASKDRGPKRNARLTMTASQVMTTTTATTFNGNQTVIAAAAASEVINRARGTDESAKKVADQSPAIINVN